MRAEQVPVSRRTLPPPVSSGSHRVVTDDGGRAGWVRSDPVIAISRTGQDLTVYGLFSLLFTAVTVVAVAASVGLRNGVTRQIAYFDEDNTTDVESVVR